MSHSATVQRPRSSEEPTMSAIHSPDATVPGDAPITVVVAL